jgi:hypothetical protein
LKKIAAIILIILFLFNLFGYRILFYYAQQQSDICLEQNLDKNIYNENELVSITVAFPMPYQQNSEGFQRFDGEVTLNGNIYKYVKRKYTDGNMTFLCLPDHNKMHLEAAKNNIVSNINDVQSNGKKSDNAKSVWGKNLLSDYTHHVTNYRISFNNISGTHYLLHKPFYLSTGLHSSPEQPPELV